MARFSWRTDSVGGTDRTRWRLELKLGHILGPGLEPHIILLASYSLDDILPEKNIGLGIGVLLGPGSTAGYPAGGPASIRRSTAVSE